MPPCRYIDVWPPVPCDLSGVTTTTVAPVPVSLPRTGNTEAIGGVGLALVVVGALLARLARR